MQRKQQEIYNTDYEGTSQLVDVVVSGDKKIKNVTLKNMDNFEKEDLEILEDMIKIALNDAFSKVDADFESKMGMYGKQLGGLF